MDCKNLNVSLENSSQFKDQNVTSRQAPCTCLCPVSTPDGDHYADIERNVSVLTVYKGFYKWGNTECA